MATLDLKKIKKTIRIFAIAQFGLIALLLYMAVGFQQQLQMLGRAQNFMGGVITAFVIQLIVFFPIFRFAKREAERDFALVDRTPTAEETKTFAKKKRWADVIKMSTFGFYFIFIMAAPNNPVILSVIYYSFILTILTYLQSYNFAAKKLAKETAAKE